MGVLQRRVAHRQAVQLSFQSPTPDERVLDMTAPKKARCESCFKLFEQRLLSNWQDEMTCEKCIQHKKAFDKRFRCECCNSVCVFNVLEEVAEDEWWCVTCRDKAANKPVSDKHSDKAWYAVAVYSDTKAKKQISDKFKKQGISHLLGRVMIPRVKQTKVTKDSYKVLAYLPGNPILQVIGHVSAQSHEDAWELAKDRFEKHRGGRGAYHPEREEQPDEFEKVVKLKGWAYEAVSRSGKVLGILRGPRSEKKALELAKKLYAPEKPNNVGPRAQVLQHYKIEDIVLEKEGGRKMEQNVRAMPGYVLVQLANDPIAFKAVKEATHGTVLPFTDPMTFEEYEDAVMFGDVPVPSSVPNKEIRRLIHQAEAVEKKPDYNIGDKIQIINGPWASSDSRYPRITWVNDKKPGKLIVTVDMIGRTIEVEVNVEDVCLAK